MPRDWLILLAAVAIFIFSTRFYSSPPERRPSLTTSRPLSLLHAANSPLTKYNHGLVDATALCRLLQGPVNCHETSSSLDAHILSRSPSKDLTHASSPRRGRQQRSSRVRHCVRERRNSPRPATSTRSSITSMTPSSSVLVALVCGLPLVSPRPASTPLAYQSCSPPEATPSQHRVASMLHWESEWPTRLKPGNHDLTLSQHARGRLAMPHVRHRQGIRLAR